MDFLITILIISIFLIPAVIEYFHYRNYKSIMNDKNLPPEHKYIFVVMCGYERFVKNYEDFEK